MLRHASQRNLRSCSSVKLRALKSSSADMSGHRSRHALRAVSRVRQDGSSSIRLSSTWWTNVPRSAGSPGGSGIRSMYLCCHFFGHCLKVEALDGLSPFVSGPSPSAAALVD